MKKFLLPLSIAIIGIATVVGCYYDKEDTLYPKNTTAKCDTVDVSYKNTIAGIMKTNCATSACHAGGNPSAGIDLSTYAGIQAIESGSPGQFFSSISWDGNASKMPKGATQQIDACAINQINSWLKQGMKDN